MRFTAFIIPLAFACSPCVTHAGSPARESEVCKDSPDDEADDCLENAEAAIKFQTALKKTNKAAIAALLEYPLQREHPLDAIESEEEFLDLWGDFFDAANIAKLTKDTPERMANGAVMLADGMVWFRDGKIITLAVRTKAYESHLAQARKKESASLHPSVRDYEHLAIECDTPTKHIRIQETDNVYQYFVWKKGTSLTQKPELSLKGTMIPDGSGGNRSYEFKNANYVYTLSDVELCEGETCDNVLTISKDGKNIAEQVCK